MVKIAALIITASVLCAGGQPQQFLPQRERGTHLARVARSVIDASRASLVAAYVVQNLLDDMRLHADVGQPGCNGPPDVVRRPLGDAGEPPTLARRRLHFILGMATFLHKL
jgi:hypothetical protein